MKKLFTRVTQASAAFWRRVRLTLMVVTVISLHHLIRLNVLFLFRWRIYGGSLSYFFSFATLTNDLGLEFFLTYHFFYIKKCSVNDEARAAYLVYSMKTILFYFCNIVVNSGSYGIILGFYINSDYWLISNNHISFSFFIIFFKF